MKLSMVIISSVLLAAFIQTACAGKAPPYAVVNSAERIARQANISGISIAKIDDGSISWTENMGVREGTSEIDDKTVFNAASLTKPVFSLLVLNLVAEGKLDLDESLSKYWVDPDVADDPRHKDLTARIVLSHQSGLPNWRGDKGLFFMFAPGSRHEYSGEGFEYLRRAIEKKLGMGVDELAKKYVFDPAGMETSSMGWNASMGSNIANGFDEKMSQIDTGITQRKPNAAAHLMTTAQDYARFLSWVAEGGNLPQDLFREMSSPQSLHDNPAERFGLGWKLVPMASGDVLFHDGREPGVRTFAAIDPATKEGLVIMTNSSNGELAYRSVSIEALSYGQSLWTSIDKLVWEYLNSMPGQALTPMSKGIARSPTYLHTFLQAANTNLIQASDLSAKLKSSADNAILPLVLRLQKGALVPSESEDLIASLIVEKNGNFALAKSLTTEKAVAWVNKLQPQK